ncbi:MAG TPA: UDP-N-acetylmuramoyl-L-alanine--D-glutamate ligase, partial [Candidatus Acidoferrum sp.]|nr:UDP-N-acetylmuramoyl-L-alanine--D-glutamate ligase [Candidatus Acidoferrum sp.]
MTAEEKIRGRKMGVLGMARSGVAAAIMGREHGGYPFVSDAADAGKLAAPIKRLQAGGIPFETGGHTDKLLSCDYLVISPGVTLAAPIIVRALDKGIPVFSELEFASWVCQGAIVAITGTNGKTTTTALTGEIFTAGGFTTFVCGNIGRAFTEVASLVPYGGVAVVEVSSFQLETIADFKPRVSVILNVTPDHLDRHGSMENYKKTKYRIAENQTAEDYYIINLEDPELATDKAPTDATRLHFSTRVNDNANTFVRDGYLWTRFEGREQQIIACDEIGIVGPHNLQNAAAAVACALPFGLKPSAIAKALATFPGVEHRLEKAGTVAGVNFINDS